MLKIKHVHKSFKKKKVLDDVTLIAEKGEIIGLVAPNGTGKTTLLNILMNFIQPDSGNIELLDKYDYSSKKNELAMHRLLSFLPDLGDLYAELNGTEHLKLYAKMWGQKTEKLEEIIKELNMEGYVKKPVRTYSLGMKQRLCFAMLLAANTDIMLMDEVMNGLDPTNVQLISSILIRLKKAGKIILIASHMLENLDTYADRILFLKDGKIILEQNTHYPNKKEDFFIKIAVTPKQFSTLKEKIPFPDNHQYIASRLLCVPLKNMDVSEISKWIEVLFENNLYQFSIGEIGTSELYDAFYES